jgi:hypothetical protein
MTMTEPYFILSISESFKAIQTLTWLRNFESIRREQSSQRGVAISLARFQVVGSNFTVARSGFSEALKPKRHLFHPKCLWSDQHEVK